MLTVRHEIEDQRVMDVIVNFTESALNMYEWWRGFKWAPGDCDKVWTAMGLSRNRNDPPPKRVPYVFPEGPVFTIEAESIKPGEETITKIVTKDDIQKGLDWLHSRIANDIVEGNDDADTADVLMQYIVYGPRPSEDAAWPPFG